MVMNCTGLHKIPKYDEVKCDGAIKSEILCIESGQLSFLQTLRSDYVQPMFPFHATNRRLGIARLIYLSFVQVSSIE